MFNHKTPLLFSSKCKLCSNFIITYNTNTIFERKLIEHSLYVIFASSDVRLDAKRSSVYRTLWYDIAATRHVVYNDISFSFFSKYCIFLIYHTHLDKNARILLVGHPVSRWHYFKVKPKFKRKTYFKRL